MLSSLAFIFLLGMSLSGIFARLKLPGLLGMLVTGVVLGPYALSAIDPSILAVSADLRQIALIIILARAGLSLDVRELKRVGRPALLMCFLPACFEISGLLAVMVMGVATFRRSPALAGRLSAKLEKLWVAAEVLLFVLVGATVDISYAVSAGANAILLVLAVLAFRVAGVLVCLAGTELNAKERLFCMVAYIPKATVQAAIGGLPLAMGLSCGNMVLTVAILSILITAPLGALGVDALYKKCLQKRE